jgi:hypothetical protein
MNPQPRIFVSLARFRPLRAGLPALAFAVLAAGFAGRSPAAVHPSGRSPDAPFTPDDRFRTERVELNRIGLRFQPETGARVRAGRLVSLTGADLHAVADLVASIPGAALGRRFPRSEEELDRDRRIGEARTKQSLPDLNLFALLTLPPAGSDPDGRARLGELLARLNAAPGVAEAWALPEPEVAGFRAVSVRPRLPVLLSNTGTAAAGGFPTRSDTPDFSGQQGYLYDSPVGVWADSVWAFAGGQGEGVRMIDMEFGWLFTHEDLHAPWYYGGAPAESDHGTAVLGEFGGVHNGYGINGIAPGMLFGAINTTDLASSINEAAGVLSPGDLYLIEIQVMGPVNWMPMEWLPDVFAAIQTTTALGILCIEAGGNGSNDLDDALYGGLFDRRVRDSGAIMVGAGTPAGLDGEWFTNYGSRLSLQGWGSSVVTACCGDLQGGDPTVRYTAGFNGTSSASPIVTGSVGCLQGQALALFGVPLTPALAEEILSVTGSPYNGTKAIGERPNLAAARERLLRGYGDVLVTVRDGETHAPMPDMIVEIAESGRFHLTGPEGQVAMQLTAGDLTFHVSGNFFYTEADFPFTVIAGGHQEAVLEVDRTPEGSLAGVVRGEDGHPIVGARLLISGTPIDTVWSGAFGAYSVSGIPQDTGYVAVASRVPGKGAAYTRCAVTAGGTTPWDPFLVNAETFEASNGGYTATGEWEWGTPTFPTGPNRPIPFSGVKCWGTDLDGPYDNLTTSVLTSPVYNLTGKTHLTLSFHHWMWIESDDGGQVQVWNAAQNRWDVVEPVGGYPDRNIIILNYGPGFNGRQTTWEPVLFPLDPYANQNFQFRFYFKSNYSGYGVGWYVDDVALDTGQGAGAVDLAAFVPGKSRLLRAGPNPSRAASTIRFYLGTPGPVQCEVYNPGGALVRRLSPGSLAAGECELRWDGRDERGRPAGSGLYLFRIDAGDAALTGRLLRIR